MRFTHVRNWLTRHSRKTIAGTAAIQADYKCFQFDLPGILADWRLKEDEVTFVDFRKAAGEWLKARSN